jgi:hypothetical protein
MIPFEGLKQDLAHSFRMMAKSPGFAGVALLTLVVGIGATAAIFSVVQLLCHPRSDGFAARADPPADVMATPHRPVVS